MIRWLWSNMMKWGWDFNRDKRGTKIVRDVLVSESMDGRSNVRIGIFTAMNGKVLEIAKRDPHHDWSYSHFLVPEGMMLSDAVTTLLIAEGLNG